MVGTFVEGPVENATGKLLTIMAEASAHATSPPEALEGKLRIMKHLLILKAMLLTRETKIHFPTISLSLLD